MQKQVYSGKPKATRDEVVEYPLRVEPITDGKVDAAGAYDLILVDCDGQVASNLVHQAAKGVAALGRGPLPQEMRRADAVVLVVDASADERQVGADFAQFAKFLKLFRAERGKRTEVAALPVFLAISKCDKLARPGDTASVWAERIEAKKESVADQFREFLDREDAALFGGLAFDSAATAVRQPNLANAQGRPDEPLGVAELFRGAFAAARDFYSRRVKSGLRLNRALFGLAAVVVALALFSGIMMLTRGGLTASPLAVAVDEFRNREGPPPAGHLTEPVSKKIDQLTELSQKAGFDQLSAIDRDFVKTRLEELRDYRVFQDRVRAVRPLAEARTPETLAAITSELKDGAAIPGQYREGWSASEAGKLREKRLAEAETVRQGVAKALEKFDSQRQTMERLALCADRTGATPMSWTIWGDKADAALGASVKPPVQAKDSIGAEPWLTWATPLGFPEVQKANTRWATARQKLERLRDILRVLGVAGAGGGDLRVPTTFSLDQCPALWDRLKQRYPDIGSWSMNDLPDAASIEVRQAALDDYRRLLGCGRAALAAAYARAPGPTESPAKWQAAIAKAKSTPDVQAWNEMETLLLQLAGAARVDPFAETAEFFAKESFSIEIRAVRLVIPDDLKAGVLRPLGPWTLIVQDANEVTTRRTYKLVGDGDRNSRDRTTTYVFIPEGPTTVTYQPGDVVWAEVAMGPGASYEWTLSWWGGPLRSRLYQFDRLGRVPRLHGKDQKADDGLPQDSIKLELIPPGGVPRLPDLFPEAR